MRYSEYVETKKRGSEGFPIQYYYLDPEQPQYIMETHWHSDFEIIRVLSGSFTVFLDDKRYVLTDGDIIFVECGCLHRGVPENCVYECVVFDMGMLRRRSGDVAERFLTPIAKNSVSVSCLIKKGETELYKCSSEIFDILSSAAPYFELKVYALLFDIFSELYKNGCVIESKKPKRSGQVKKISELLDWIDDNYAEKITLDQLEEISGISKKYICRIFKKYTDRTPINYVNEIRVENACYELSFSDKSITDIAYSNGFEDVSYFSKLFKAHKSLTPLEYRKRHK